MESLAFGEFRGDVVSADEYPGFLLCETHHSGSDQIGWHAHETPYFCLVLKGGFDETSAAGTWSCGPGTATFHAGDDPHADRLASTGASCLNIQLSPNWSGLIPNRSAVSPGSRLAWAATHIAASYRTGSVSQDQVAAVAAASAIPVMTEKDPRMRDVRRRIRSRLDRPLGLSDIANDLGLHPVYLARRFHAAYGMTCGQYLAHARVTRATRLVASTTKTLGEIALQCGYFDQSHFTNAFRSITGLTPAAYRACYEV